LIVAGVFQPPDTQRAPSPHRVSDD